MKWVAVASFFVCFASLSRGGESECEGKWCSEFMGSLKKDILPSNSTTISVEERNNSTTSVGERNNSTTSVTERNNSTNSITERNNSTTSVTERNNSTTSVGERNNSTTSVTERNNSTNSITERNNSTTSVTERNNSTTSVGERNNSTTSVTERNNSTTSVTERNNSTTSVGERNNSTTSVTERNNSTSSVRERKKKHRECSDGSKWYSNCHGCWCSEDGHAVCTRMEVCLTGDYGDPIRCKPNTTFMIDCNECTCLESGQVACTMLKCMSEWPSFPISEDLPALPEYIDGSALLEPEGDYTESLSTRRRKGRKDCQPGSRWQSRCNECLCTENGLPACTEMACPEEENDPVRTCAPDSQWMNDCNNCWCDSGSAVCTRMGCNIPIIMDFRPIGASSSTEKAQMDQAPSSDGNRVKRRANICKPTAAFKVFCNDCECASDGQSYSCTNYECMERGVNDDVEVFMETEGADHIERHTVCKPRGIFYIGCNTCHCSADGLDFSCTNKPCPLPKDVEVFHELKALKSVPNEKNVVCAANRMFIKDCNTCWCNEDGTSYFCTRKVCITDLPDEVIEEQPENQQELKRKCKPDEVFELDCNMCRCNSDGMGFSCTRRACVPEDKAKNLPINRSIRATAQGPPKNCKPGTEFRMDCNKCLCDNEGQNYSCTRIDCAALNGNGNGATRKKRATAQVQTQCVPESVFNQGCNVCRCEADGNHATCSIKRCKEDNPDEDADDLSPDSDLSFRCNPGEQFKRGCNDCTCSADGKSVFCTIRLCDQDITPAI